MSVSYIKRLEYLKKLTKSKGLGKEELNSLVSINFKKNYLPDELYFFYEYINYTESLSLEVIYSLEEAIEIKNEYIDLFCFDNWIPLCMSDGFIHFAMLYKKNNNNCEIYYVDVGGGDSNMYLYTPNILSFINLEIERIEVFNKTGVNQDYRDLYLKFIPDAYPYFEEKRQEGFYSKNGVRNLYDTLELESLPKEWF